MTDRRCGCCKGTEPLTPLPTANRPGLDALRYRVGTHATFLETMLARLSSHRLADGRRPLQRLTTRALDDPAIALLDAWATVADVLTFYQERIANEGYLLTATERRSVLELARLVGYELRPGVAASVYLAFTLEKDYEIEVPEETAAQSIPEPGELPQVFETAEPLPARTRWNAIPARQTRPSFLQPTKDFGGTRTFYVGGAVTDLKVNGAVLFVCDEAQQQQPKPYTIKAVEADAEAERTRVTYGPLGLASAGDVEPGEGDDDEIGEGGNDTKTPGPALTRTLSLVQALRKPPSLPPPSRFQLARQPERTYSASADLAPRLLTRFVPRLRDTLYTAYAKAPLAAVPDSECRVEAFRVKTAPFGYNTPKERKFDDHELQGPTEWELVQEDLQANAIFLDAVYDKILPGSTVVIVRPEIIVSDNFGRSSVTFFSKPIVATVQQVRTVSRADYGISARVTRLGLDREWLADGDIELAVLRGTTIYAQNEPLDLAEEPIEGDVGESEIELDGLYDGLEAGRWLMVTGERADVVDDATKEAVEGVEARELVLLAGVEHRISTVPPDDGDGETVELPGDTLHTHLILSDPLAYKYKRETVRVNANVARATHGETRREVLGSGDGARAFQRFALKQSPLTHVAAPTPAGVESTLEVRVDDVRWPEQETLLFLGGNERGYETKTADEGTTSVLFGDGKRGARLPTGVENVTAVYRSGIGKGGNVASGAISTLATRPLGVKEVINPARASGGADPESRDQARRNVPLAVLALDRLVSVEDYASFTRRFAGIGKASAASLSDGRREVVFLTIAGADDVPIDEGSDLHRNLLRALRRFGDPNVPLRVEPREAVFLFLSARVKVLEDYLWDKVEPKIRAALLDAFGFDRRELAQDVLLSEVIATIQAVEGVDYVDVDLLEGVSETDADDPKTLAEKLASFIPSSGPESAPGAFESFAAGGETVPSTGEAGTGEPSDADEPRPKRRLRIETARVDTHATEPSQRLRPAQLAYLNPDLPDTLVLAEVTS